MALVPAPVAVVTTRIDGQPYGTTVSAFFSLSINPPTVAVSFDQSSTLLAKLRLGSLGALNVLAADQVDVAAHFARKEKGALERLSDDDPPLVSDAQAQLVFAVVRMIPVEDHVLVIGRVSSAAEAAGHSPLIYWHRGYGTHTSA